MAIARNPVVSAAAFDQDAAVAGRETAEGLRLPSIRGVVGYAHSLDSQRLAPATENGQSGVFSRDILGADLILGIPLYSGGRITSQIRGAEWEESAAAHRADRVADDLRFQVSRVFFVILAEKRLIDSLRFSRNALEEHLRRVEDLLSLKKAARVDLLRTEVRLADIEEQLARTENSLLVLRRTFGNLLGLDAGDLVPEPRGELAGEADSAPGAEAATETALGRRADLLAARSSREVIAQAVEAARADCRPDVTIEAAYGARWAAGSTEHPAGTDDLTDLGRIGVVVTVPIFEGGRLSGRIRREQARLRAADERIRSLERQVRLEIETALADLSSARVRIETAAKSVDRARESLRIETERYGLGKGAIVDVLDAQSALLDAETTWHRALTDASVAQSRLDLAMGRP